MASRRGTALGMVLGVISLAMVLAVAFCAGAVFHLNLSAQDASRRAARNVAESALGIAMDRILYDPTFGATPVVVPAAGHDATAQVAFGPSGALASTNNLQGMKSVVGANGAPVPAYSALLYASGSSGNARVVMKALLTLPGFPFVIASAGAFNATGALRVRRGDGSIDTGSMFSNSSSPQAIVLPADTIVDGDVGAAGAVVVPSGARIGGSLQQNQAAVTIPVIAAEGYDPAELPDCKKVTPSNSLSVSGMARSGNALTVGDVHLQNGILFVAGDLKVTGSIAGTGAIFATGNLEVDQQAALSSDDQVALVVDGNCTLHGQDMKSSIFHGIVSTGGSFDAKDITVQGLFLQSSASGQTTLSNVTIIQDSSMSDFQFTVPGTSSVMDTGLQGLQVGSSSLGSNVSALMIVKSLNDNPDHYTLSSNFSVVVDTPGLGFWPHNSPQQFPAFLLAAGLTPADMSKLAAGPGQFKTRAQLDSVPFDSLFYSFAAITQVDAESSSLGAGTYWSVGSVTGKTQLNTMLDDLASGKRTPPVGAPVPPAACCDYMKNHVADIESYLKDAIAFRLQQLQREYDHYVTLHGPTQNAVFSIDINQFISNADRARIELWQEGP